MRYTLLVSLVAFQAFRTTKAQICDANNPAVPTIPCMNDRPTPGRAEGCCARNSTRALWSQYSYYKAGAEDKERECKLRESTACQRCTVPPPTFVCATNCSAEIAGAKADCTQCTTSSTCNDCPNQCKTYIDAARSDCSQCTTASDAQIADARREILQYSWRNGVSTSWDRRVVKLNNYGELPMPDWYRTEYNEYSGSAGVYRTFWGEELDDTCNLPNNYGVKKGAGVVQWTQIYPPVRFFLRDSVPRKFGINKLGVTNTAAYDGGVHPHWDGMYIYSRYGILRLSSHQDSPYTLLSFSMFIEVGPNSPVPGDYLEIDCNRPGSPGKLGLPYIPPADFQYRRAIITYKDVNLVSGRSQADADLFITENFCTFIFRDGNGVAKMKPFKLGMLTVKA